MKTSRVVFGLLLCVVLVLVDSERAWAQKSTPVSSNPIAPVLLPPGDFPDPNDIIGGVPASAEEFPWQVALVVASKPNPKDGQDCAGSLIDVRWVVTAAHCVVAKGVTIDPALRNVVLGVTKLSNAPSSGTEGQRIAIDRIIVHPAYNDVILDNDIALIHLTQPAVLGPTVQTIAYAGALDSDLFQPGANATVTGWGKTEGGAVSDELRKVDLPVVSYPVCLAAMSRVTGNMLCAGDEAGGKSACNGDSGGPLVVADRSGGRLLAGIVSWGSAQCASPKKYGVFTRVSLYQEWITTSTSTHPLLSVYLPFLERP
jgi:secreted trypsin-like serine protease